MRSRADGRSSLPMQHQWSMVRGPGSSSLRDSPTPCRLLPKYFVIALLRAVELQSRFRLY